MKGSFLVTFLLILCASCTTQRSGVISFQHSPLLKNIGAALVPLNSEDSTALRIMESMVADTWSPSEQASCEGSYVFRPNEVRVFTKKQSSYHNVFHMYYPDEMMSVIYKKNAKILMGFSCDYYKILETKVTKNSKSKFLYELYTTDKFEFPTALYCGWFESILKEMPLEVKITDTKYPQYYSKIVTTSINKNAHDDMFILGPKFKN